jgi:predicted nucleotide-binding protein
VFLFTRDDLFKGKGEQAAPRDNVIFEAGFFVRSKGHARVLIVREKGAKMPADLGGVIYETLADTGDVHDLEGRLRLFLSTSI